MKRRSVRVGTLALTLHLLASPLVAVAQPTGKVHRIGFLRHFACPDQFFKGAQPAELPVEQPTKLDLVINGRIAKALGLALPRSILLRAVEVLE